MPAALHRGHVYSISRCSTRLHWYLAIDSTRSVSPVVGYESFVSCPLTVLRLNNQLDTPPFSKRHSNDHTHMVLSLFENSTLCPFVSTKSFQGEHRKSIAAFKLFVKLD